MFAPHTDTDAAARPVVVNVNSSVVVLGWDLVPAAFTVS